MAIFSASRSNPGRGVRPSAWETACFFSRKTAPRPSIRSAHIPPGRDGLFDLVKTLPATLRYENHIAAATGDFVILHGRFSGLGQTPTSVVADIVRMEDGVLAEHWDVIQDEATREQSRSGLPMFGDKFPA